MRILFVLLALLSSCVCLADPLKLPDDNAERTARIASYHRDFPSARFALVYVPSKGLGSDAFALASIRSGAGSSNTRELSKQIAGLAGSPRRVAVTGANDQLAAETLLFILGALQPSQVANLNLAYIGAPGYESQLRAAGEKLGIEIAYVLHP